MSLRDQAIAAMEAAFYAADKYDHPSRKEAGCSGHCDAHSPYALDGLLQWLRDNRHAITLAAYLKTDYAEAEEFDQQDEWWGVVSDHYATGFNAVPDLLAYGGEETQ